jgi:SAM-dependent methyltransferase
MLSELFDGAGPLATGLGRNRLSEALTRVLELGTPGQRQAAAASAVASRSLTESRAGMVDFHSRIARGELTEEAFLRGRPLAERLRYPMDVVDGLPDALVQRFIGLANPFAFGRAESGDVVVDVGCGAGLDAAVAAHDVGSDGVVLGLDATYPMVLVAAGLVTPSVRRQWFAQSFAEQLPVRSASVDLVTSNGVFMMTNRPVALTECHRVLRPGGRLQFGDQVFNSRPGHELVDEWHSLQSKALTRDRWRDLLVDVGFVGVEFGPPDHPERTYVGPAGGRAVMARKP